MKKELDKTYQALEHEDAIYDNWEKSGFFNPDNLELPEEAENYTIILPPPNITAKLHLGHASTVAIEDLLVRYNRLLGKRTLWLPGTDHAAIATQNVVEKKLLNEQGLSRHDLGREKFLEEVWKFLKETQGTILYQMKKMGASLDWSRLAFTLDEERQFAVKKMFKDMYDEGIIYRGERLVNWCPRCHSTLADDEVDYKEQEAGFYTFKYDKDFPISISTTRPETKLGDTAVAVNPKDERYIKYIGQTIKANFCGQNLKIKIIADRQVEMDFGTGALGVTPAHSATDFKIAEDNDLQIIKVINEDGLIKSGFGEFSGLKTLEARKLIIEKLKDDGLLEKEEEIKNNLSICYRCSSPIEPILSKQWFISVDKKLERLGGKSLKEKAIEAARLGNINFIPERFNKRYLDWMENLHDWCISRQIWFGHQIPVWYKGDEVYVGLVAPIENDWQQDPDTLDTWFSSGMWTFSTLGWPDNYKDGQKTADLKKFHPTQVLETGYEILTLWVSRMIMMSFFALGEIPFDKVYLHGMILDEKGKKMSKSKGNGIDPLDMANKYGADATRLALLTGSTPGNDVRFSEDKIEAKRNFINKLWNISRFIINLVEDKTSTEEVLKTGEEIKTAAEVKTSEKSLADKWIIAELENTKSLVTEYLNNYNFSLAAEVLHDFTWNKLADWYLEIAKIEGGKNDLLKKILKDILILWHPFIPFVTETIWQSFFEGVLMVEKWPKAKELEEKDQEALKDFALIQELVVAIRNLRSENKIEPSKKIKAVIFGHEYKNLIESQKHLILNLKTGIESLEVKESGNPLENSLVTVVNKIEIYLLGAIDETKKKAALIKEKENLEKLISLQKQKLDNKDFVSRAPENIVKAEQEKLENYQIELEKINKNTEKL